MNPKLIAGYLKCWRMAKIFCIRGGIHEVNLLLEAKNKIWLEMKPEEQMFAQDARIAGEYNED